MPKSLGVKKTRPAATAPPAARAVVNRPTSSQPTYTQPPPAPALFAKRQTSSPLASDTADSLKLDRLRIASASSSASASPATSPTATTLASLASASCIQPLPHRSLSHSALAADVHVNPFALPTASPSLLQQTSAPLAKFDFARPANRTVCKTNQLSLAIAQPPVPTPALDKRKRTLSNELHADRLHCSNNPSKRSNNTATAAAVVPLLHSDLDCLTSAATDDNSTFAIPPPPLPPSSTTRKSLPDPPRRRKPTASHRSLLHQATADDQSQPRSVIDMTVSPLPEKQPFASFPQFRHGAAAATAGVTKVDVRLLFDSQCSQAEDEQADERRSQAVDPLPAIVYDSQEPEGELDEDLSEQQTQPGAPSPLLPAERSNSAAAATLLPLPLASPLFAPPRQSSSALNQLRASQSSILHRAASGLQRTSSLVSLGSCTQEYCTPLDQFVQPRTDEQRNLDLFNARMLHQSAAAATSVASAFPASSSPFGASSPSPLAAVSVNTFLPFASRHGSDEAHTRGAGQSAGLDGAVSGSRLLSDYVVLETVGEGAFGCVLRCRHRLDGCTYAVKRMKRVSTGHVNRLAELREAWALSALMTAAHPPPSLLLYHTSWLEDHQLHVVTQWCDGPTLQQAMTQQRMSEEEVILLLQHVCGALRHLHALGVAHLDIKPSNILLSSASTTPPPLSHIQPATVQYKLLDYGLLTPLSSQPQSLHSCGDRQYVPLYAVEHEDSCECLDKVDVYMLGLSALEAVRGRALSDAERERVRVGGEVRSVIAGHDGEGEVSDKLVNVLEGMLCLDMEQRWDADAVLKQLDSSEGRVREMEARLAALSGEVEELQQRCSLAERDRDSGREKQVQLEKYVRDVQLHMSRLHC